VRVTDGLPVITLTRCVNSNPPAPAQLSPRACLTRRRQTLAGRQNGRGAGEGSRLRSRVHTTLSTTTTWQARTRCHQGGPQTPPPVPATPTSLLRVIWSSQQLAMRSAAARLGRSLLRAANGASTRSYAAEAAPAAAAASDMGYVAQVRWDAEQPVWQAAKQGWWGALQGWPRAV
jgi:hypothetical protein